jgi:hypothetical protein
MPNAVERWLVRRTGETPRTTFGVDATTSLLRRLVPVCAACRASLAHHAYRFFASHPATPSPATDDFLQSIHNQEWASVFETQLPAVDQSIFVLYAISCPSGGGMTALVLAPDGPQDQNELVASSSLSDTSMAALRSVCPACKWISFDTQPG